MRSRVCLLVYLSAGVSGVCCSAVLMRRIDCLGSFSVCLSGSPYIALSVSVSLSLQDIDWVQTEKHVFEQASTNPFLVGLHSCFQTESR